MRSQTTRTLACLLLLVFAFQFELEARGSRDEEKPAVESSSPAIQELEKRWGVKVEAVRTTARGFMIDFRYRVVDAEKSTSILDRNITPYLVEQKTGAKMPVVRSRFGPMRQTSPKPTENRTYTIIFSNPKQSVQRGDKVTVVVGDFKAENLLVQ